MRIASHACGGIAHETTVVSCGTLPPACLSSHLQAFRRQSHTNSCLDECLEVAHSTSSDSLVVLLRHCRNVLDGRRYHANIQKCGHDQDTFLGNCLVDMYGSCKCLQDAHHVFVNLHHPNVFSWNIIIKAYVQNGDLDAASMLFTQMPKKDGVSWNTMMTAFIQNEQDTATLYLFKRMLLECVFPDRISLLCVLYACSKAGSVEQGLMAHVLISTAGYEQSMAIGTALSNMYGKCGNLQLALMAFETIQKPDVIAWSTIVSIFVHNGLNIEALNLFLKMWHVGLTSNVACFISALDACATLMEIEVGREIHLCVVEMNLVSDTSIINTLISMYGNSGHIYDARNVFDCVKDKNVVSWNALIACLVHDECSNEALDMFRQMQLEKVTPDRVTFLCALDACATLSNLIVGQEIHAFIICIGLERDTVIGTALINMYGKCTQLQDADIVFRKIPYKDMVCWNALIAVLSQNRYDVEALSLFQRMQKEGVMPDHISFVCALEACSSLNNGYDIHNAIIATGHDRCVEVSNALVCMYGRSSDLNNAKLSFRSMPSVTTSSWNAFIGVLSRSGSCREALQLFQHMKHQVFHPDKISYVCVLDACASLEALEEGMEIHFDIVNIGYENDVMVSTAIITMYGRCLNVQSAYSVFDSKFQSDVVTWNAMFTVLTQNENHTEALYLLYQMQHAGIKPNRISFLCVLDACAGLTSLIQGMEVHAYVIEAKMEMDTVIRTGLVNMYGKCGSTLEARSAFVPLCSRDVICWNTMLAAYAQSGQVAEALDSYKCMLSEGVCPDETTFVCLLTACSHAGHLDMGKCLFAHMNTEQRISWMRDHFGCMIDMLSRAGIMDEAEALTHQMPSEAGSVAWPSILSACRLHYDLDRGMRAAKHCFEREPRSMASHLTLSSMMDD